MGVKRIVPLASLNTNQRTLVLALLNAEKASKEKNMTASAPEMIGGTRTQREYNLGLQRKFLQDLYKLHEPNQEFKASYYSLAEATGIPSNVVGNVIQLLEKQNLLTRRFQWNGQAGGRQAYWTLMANYEHANNVLAKHQHKVLEKPARGTLSRPAQNGQMPLPALPDPVMLDGERASEAAMRLASESENSSNTTAIDVAKDMVNKTRQYMLATDLINSNLKMLRDAGVEVNEDAYFESVKVKQDPTFAAIALVMPYINSLENK